MNKLWRPDVFFVDSQEASRHDIITDNLFLDIKPSGEIMVSERLTVKISCYMNYKWFPFDSQVCPVYLESYAYRAHQMVLEWREGDPFQEKVFQNFDNFFYTLKKTGNSSTPTCNLPSFASIIFYLPTSANETISLESLPASK